MAPPINPHTHPPNRTYTHPRVGESPQISNLQMELKYLDSFKCYWIFTDLGGPTWAGGGGRQGVKWGFGDDVGWQGQHGDDRDNMGMTWERQGRWGRHHYHDKHVGGHLQFLYMCVCVCVCAYMHVCACVHVWGVPPHSLHTHPPTHPEPQGVQNTKIQ